MLDKELLRKEVEVTRQLERASIAVSTYRHMHMNNIKCLLYPISTVNTHSVQKNLMRNVSHLMIYRSSFSTSMRGAKIFVFRI